MVHSLPQFVGYDGRMDEVVAAAGSTQQSIKCWTTAWGAVFVVICTKYVRYVVCMFERSLDRVLLDRVILDTEGCETSHVCMCDRFEA